MRGPTRDSRANTVMKESDALDVAKVRSREERHRRGVSYGFFCLAVLARYNPLRFLFPKMYCDALTKHLGKSVKLLKLVHARRKVEDGIPRFLLEMDVDVAVRVPRTARHQHASLFTTNLYEKLVNYFAIFRVCFISVARYAITGLGVAKFEAGAWSPFLVTAISPLGTSSLWILSCYCSLSCTRARKSM